jgi:hypothetical protein
MAMIDKAAALGVVLGKIKAMEQGHGLELLTYKRDRAVIIRRSGPEAFCVIQNGFEQARYKESAKGLRPLLKRLLKKEFPRSNKVRLRALSPDDGPC